MDKFEHLVEKYFKEGVMEFNRLTGGEQIEICQAYFDHTEGEYEAIIIVSSLFPGQSCYLHGDYADADLGEKANKVIDAFNLHIGVINEIGTGPDLSCEFLPNGRRW